VRRQLEDRDGAPPSGEAPRRDRLADREWPAIPVEEDEVEREAHAEGVDAGAARDQEAGTGLVPVEVGEAEQASPEADRDRHLATEDDCLRQPPQAPR
jgi:hypothetical protein